MPKYIVQESGVVPNSQKLYNGKQMHSIAIVTTTGESGEQFCAQSQQPYPAGAEIEGTFEPSQYGMKFKKAQSQQGGGFKNDPTREARIVRQHSQEMALRYLTLKGAPVTSITDLRDVIDWFDNDALNAKPKSGPQQQTLDQAVTSGQVPADPAGESIPF